MLLDGKTACFLVPNYMNKGRHVILLCGRRWTDAMVQHAIGDVKPFHVRPQRHTEPNTYPNGHPWGWVYKVDDFLKDESRWLDQESLEKLQSVFHKAIEDLNAVESKRLDASTAGYI